MKYTHLMTFMIALTVMAGAFLVLNTTDDSDATADPTTGTQIGDLYYTFSGAYANVVGYSSSIDWTTFTSIPDTVTYNGVTYTILNISQNAFLGCTNLTLTSLPSGVTSIGNQAFAGCTHLALTSLPSGLVTIGSSAFGDCTQLALTELPSGVRTIGSTAFQRCTSLALTSLPNGVTTISKNTFQGCTNLALTELPTGLTSIGHGAFYDCTSLALISLPAGLTNIGNTAFQNCTGLHNMIIIGSPTIGTDAFKNTGIKEVLNLGETEITTTSYGLNADSVRSDVSALGYIAPTHIQIQEGLDGVPLAILKLVPILLIVSILLVLIIPMIQSRTDETF